MANNNWMNPFARQMPGTTNFNVTNNTYLYAPVNVGAQAGAAPPGLFGAMQGQSTGSDMYGGANAQSLFGAQQGQMPTGSMVGPAVQDILFGQPQQPQGAMLQQQPPGGMMPGQVPGGMMPAQGGGQPSISGAVMNCMMELSSMMASVMGQLTGFIETLMAKQAEEKQAGAGGEHASDPTKPDPAADGAHDTDGVKDSHGSDDPEKTEESSSTSLSESDAKSAFEALDGGDVEYKTSEGDKDSASAFEIADADEDGIITKDELESIKDTAEGDKPKKKDDPEAYDDYQKAKALEKELGGKKALEALGEHMDALSVTAEVTGDDVADGEDNQFSGLSEDDVSAIHDKLEKGSIEEIETENATEYEDAGVEGDVEALKTWVKEQAGDSDSDSEDAEVNADVKKAMKKMFSSKFEHYAGDDKAYSSSEIEKYLDDEDLDIEDPDAVAEQLAANFDNIAAKKSNDNADEKSTIDEKDADAITDKMKGADATLKKALGAGKYTDPEKVSSDQSTKVEKLLTKLDDKKEDDVITDKEDLASIGITDDKTKYLLHAGLKKDGNWKGDLTVKDLKALKEALDDGLSISDLVQDGVDAQKNNTKAMELITKAAAEGKSKGISGDDEWKAALDAAGDDEGVKKAITAIKENVGELTKLDGNTGKKENAKNNPLSEQELKDFNELFTKGYTVDDLVAAGKANKGAKPMDEKGTGVMADLKKRDAISEITKKDDKDS